MQEILTADQMRDAERAAIRAGAVTGLELMERAGRDILAALIGWRSDLGGTPHRALVLCGPGNNGGDGFVVARMLRDRGWSVALHLYGNADKLPPDAAENCRRWREAGKVLPLRPDAFAEGTAPDLLVDALFGTGLTRPLPEDLRAAIAYLNAGPRQWRGESHRACLAVDCPSGLDLDSGRFLGASANERLRADLTVTFAWAKLGHHLADGPAWCGRLDVRPLGLPGEGMPPQTPGEGVATRRVLLLDSRPGRFLGQAVTKAVDRHKYGHGHALVLSGPVRRTGAARLAARGALHVGAGLVTIAGEIAALDEHATQVTAIMLREIDSASALADFLDADPRIGALCMGPGMGVDATTRKFVRAALASGRAAVLDADAMTAFAGEPEALFAALHPRCVLTPHTGEFGRVFPDLGKRLRAPAETGPAFSRVEAVRAAAARAGCVVLLKGPDTVIGDAEGRVTVHGATYERAAPWLATAGAGDVLAGMIAGLLARGQDPHPAAAAAAWLHGEAARRFGPGLVSEDLPAMLPRVFRALGL